MKTSNGDACIIIEPDDDSRVSWIEAGVISARYGVASTAARNDREGFERSRLKMLPNITDHALEYRLRTLSCATRPSKPSKMRRIFGERRADR